MQVGSALAVEKVRAKAGVPAVAVVVPLSAVPIDAESSVSFMPATEPASIHHHDTRLRTGTDLNNCTIVGIKAARNTMTRRRMLVMMNMRWVT